MDHNLSFKIFYMIILIAELKKKLSTIIQENNY